MRVSLPGEGDGAGGGLLLHAEAHRGARASGRGAARGLEGAGGARSGEDGERDSCKHLLEVECPFSEISASVLWSRGVTCSSRLRLFTAMAT